MTELCEIYRISVCLFEFDNLFSRPVFQTHYLLSFYSSNSTAFITFMLLYNVICTILYGESQVKFIPASSKREFKSIFLRRVERACVSRPVYHPRECLKIAKVDLERIKETFKMK